MNIKDLPARRLDVAPVLSDEETQALLGTMLPEDCYTTLLRDNVDVYCAKTGACLLKFRRNVIPVEIVKKAYAALKDAAVSSNNRGMAAGVVTQEQLDELAKKLGTRGYVLSAEGSTRYRRVLADGTLSATTYAIPVNSGVVGFLGGNPRMPYCRQTAYTQAHWDKFVDAYPIIKQVDEFYRELMPEPYALQRAQADKTSSDFVIKDTAFTTVTVNKNWQTACHTDQGDFDKGFGNLVALRKGKYVGGYFVLPQYKIAVDMQNCDMLLVDVHKVHGNTPIQPIDKHAVRVSLVMYYREDMASCGTADAEINKARSIVDERIGISAK